MTPQIIMPEGGFHNARLDRARDRLFRGQSYRDLSTICVIPTRGLIPARIVQSWMSLMAPMNQRFIRLFMEGMEVGEAYNQAVEFILNNPELSKWKYLLTLEEDNAPPPDALLKLYEGIKEYDAVGALYWTKFEGGMPMIYGDPSVMPKNFVPQLPQPETIQPCNGLGMGFTLFRLDLFRKVPKPWFKTLQEFTPGVGARAYTQDLYFFEKAGLVGARFACDTRVKVGHLDPVGGVMW